MNSLKLESHFVGKYIPRSHSLSLMESIFFRREKYVQSYIFPILLRVKNFPCPRAPRALIQLKGPVKAFNNQANHLDEPFGSLPQRRAMGKSTLMMIKPNVMCARISPFVQPALRLCL